MFCVDLSAEETGVLQRVPDSYLSELKEEIAHTDRRESRQMLRGEEEVVKRVIHELGSEASSEIH